MAASGSFKWCALLSLFVLLFFHVLPASSSVLSSYKVKLRSRFKKDVCQDGTYEYEGKTCCLCGAGLFLKKHCTVRADDRQCELCPNLEYNSHASSKESCEPCTSCSHPNANLEEAESCTSARDAVCQCKPQHYCSLKPCKICYPCKKCGEEGIKVACKSPNDTICNDQAKGGGLTVGASVGIAFAVLILIGLVIVAVWFWRKKQSGAVQLTHVQSDAPAAEKLVAVPEVDLTPYLPDIVKVLTWMDVRDIAMQSKMTQAEIQSCQSNHPNDITEQTLQLLSKWVNLKGMKASTELVKMLENANKTLQAEKIRCIVNPQI